MKKIMRSFHLIQHHFNLKSGFLMTVFTLVVICLSIYIIRHNSINPNNHIDIPSGIVTVYLGVIGFYAGSKTVDKWKNGAINEDK